MKSARDFSLVFVTAGRKITAVSLAKALVQKKLVACVNLVPNILSIYPWKNKIHQDKEFLLILKTQKKNLRSLEKQIRSMHTYEIPEILSVSLNQGSSSYLKWLQESLQTKKG